MKLPAIPVIDVGPDFPAQTLKACEKQAHDLMNTAAGHLPKSLLRAADAVSRRWLRRWKSPYLHEIENISRTINRPGAIFLNVHYEWGCTTGVHAAPDGRSARLTRVLDWRTKGLGRYLVAAQIASDHGDWVSLTWPGFTGVLQAMAPGRFAAALNQAPMDMPFGLLPVDWVANRLKVWRTPHLTPAHLLRRTFERAATFEEAKDLLCNTPICVPTIYTLCGLRPGEGVVIERGPESYELLPGDGCAANRWQTPHWRGRDRGKQNRERIQALQAARPDLATQFDWLVPPILNETTRLAMVADPALGELVARGYESDGPATEPLTLRYPGGGRIARQLVNAE